jgi:hypothetical protein
MVKDFQCIKILLFMELMRSYAILTIGNSFFSVALYAKLYNLEGQLYGPNGKIIRNKGATIYYTIKGY